MNEKQKRAVLGALLAMVEREGLPHGSFAKIGARLGVPASSVARLWRASKSSREAQQVLSPDVTSKKKGNEQYKEPQTIYSREEVMEQIKDIPLDKRSTVRHAAAELKIPKSTVQSVRKRGEWKWKSCGVGAEVYMEMMKEYVVPAIMEKWPLDAGIDVIKLQHDNAPAHFKETVPEWVEYMEHFERIGMPYKLKLIHQPAQSPDTNILDLGFFAALQSTCLGRPKDEMELIEMVQQQYEAYPAKLINRVWLSHMACMNEILKDNGGNNYKIPHLSKAKLEREGRLPWVLEVNKDAMDRLKGQGFQPPTVDYSIPGSVNGRAIMRVSI